MRSIGLGLAFGCAVFGGATGCGGGSKAATEHEREPIHECETLASRYATCFAARTGEAKAAGERHVAAMRASALADHTPEERAHLRASCASSLERMRATCP